MNFYRSAPHLVVTINHLHVIVTKAKEVRQFPGTLQTFSAATTTYFQYVTFKMFRRSRYRKSSKHE